MHHLQCNMNVIRCSQSFHHKLGIPHFGYLNSSPLLLNKSYHLSNKKQMFLKILQNISAEIAPKQTSIKRLKITYYMASRKMNERLKRKSPMPHLIFSFVWFEVMGFQRLKSTTKLQHFFG